MTTATKNEGEGSRSAAREYDERTRTFIEKNDVATKAAEARVAIDGSEADALKQAEREGKAKARGLDSERPKEH